MEHKSVRTRTLEEFKSPSQHRHRKSSKKAKRSQSRERRDRDDDERHKSHRKHKRKRSCSRDRSKKQRDRSRSKDRKRHRSPSSRHRSTSRRRSSSKRRSSPTRRKSPPKQEPLSPSSRHSAIDKAKLLEIAQANLTRAITLSLQHQASEQVKVTEAANAEIQSQRPSNSVADFIKLCATLSQNQKLAGNVGAPNGSEFERKEVVKHGFRSINWDKTDAAKQSPDRVPPSNTADLTRSFPVSCGNKHRLVAESVEARNGSMLNSDARESQSNDVLVFEPHEIPGKFRRDASQIKLLTPDQLEGGLKAWVRKDCLMNAEPVQSEIGVKLMRKMGWKMGQGLGKNEEGRLEPIKVEVKVDRKGLISRDLDRKPSKSSSSHKKSTTTSNLPGQKNPVSVLSELCAARHWPQPVYEVTMESGPAHAKNFQMRVIVNRVEYRDFRIAANKKQAKTNAADACLRQIWHP